MACTSPNQWATGSPTRLTEDANAELLDHVRQLIVDLLVDDIHSLSQSTEAGAAHAGPSTAKHQHSNNPEVEEASTREKLLEQKLARTLVELAGEQDNLRLAANAGNALLDQLRSAREEVDALHDELEAAQITGERSERDLQRLKDQNKALENELQRYDPPFTSWETWQEDSSTQVQRRRSLRSSRSRSFNKSLNDGSNACELCEAREAEVVQLEQRADEFRRRCLELELASEREQQRGRELSEEMSMLKKCSKDQQTETTRVQHDLDFVTTQLCQRAEELESAKAARDALRRTIRRLEAENEDIQARLATREELIAKLENGKARATTQIQVAENRTASAQAETKRVTEALQQLQSQLDRLRQQQSGHGSADGQSDDDVEVAPQEQAVRDMEQLLGDATREVAALRLENRILRRQSSDMVSDGSLQRRNRRKTLCVANTVTTAAEVLALDSQKSNKEAGTRTVSVSDGEPTTTSSQVPPLELETVKNDATDDVLTGLTTTDGKRRRKMSLELNWVDMPSTSPKTGKSGKCDEPEEVEGLTSVAKRPGSLSRHINDHCVVGGATKVNTSDVDVHLYDVEPRQTRRSRISSSNDSGHPRLRELQIEDLSNAAVNSPPKSPLVLGLSFIACATAATAAGLFVRR